MCCAVQPAAGAPVKPAPSCHARVLRCPSVDEFSWVSSAQGRDCPGSSPAVPAGLGWV